MSAWKMEKDEMTTKKRKPQYKSYITINDKSIFDSVLNRVSSKQNGSTVILPHVCNAHSFISSKFAAVLNEKYPSLSENFKMLSKDAVLGKTQFVKVFEDSEYKHSIIIANMICQQTATKFSSRLINYGALSYCMNSVRFKAKEIKKSEEEKIEIHAPKFGCGNSGGNWVFISNLIEDIWLGLDTYIYSK